MLFEIILNKTDFWPHFLLPPFQTFSFSAIWIVFSLFCYRAYVSGLILWFIGFYPCFIGFVVYADCVCVLVVSELAIFLAVVYGFIIGFAFLTLCKVELCAVGFYGCQVGSAHSVLIALAASALRGSVVVWWRGAAPC